MRAADICLEHDVFMETGPHKHAIQQTFFLYVYEPGGNRFEIANAGARLMLAPDWQTSRLERGRTQKRPGLGIADHPIIPYARHAAGGVSPMPHLTLEYTDNLDFDVQPLLARLHTELVATGAVNLKGIKSRAIRHSDYRIADGNPEYAFVHVNLLIREGRPLEVQKDAAQRVMAVLKETFGQSFRERLSVPLG